MSAMFITLTNLILCTIWGWGAFQRLRLSNKYVIPRVRAIYAGMVVAATASGFQLQLFGEYAGYADLTVSTTMVAFIALGSKRWKYGVPLDLVTRSKIIR